MGSRLCVRCPIRAATNQHPIRGTASARTRCDAGGRRSYYGHRWPVCVRRRRATGVRRSVRGCLSAAYGEYGRRAAAIGDDNADRAHARRNATRRRWRGGHPPGTVAALSARRRWPEVRFTFPPSVAVCRSPRDIPFTMGSPIRSSHSSRRCSHGESVRRIPMANQTSQARYEHRAAMRSPFPR